MKWNRSHALRLLTVLLLILILAGCRQLSSGGGSREQPDLTVLTIGTADSGGTMVPAGKAIAQAITAQNASFSINIGASTGSSMNVIGLANGEIDLGLVSGDVAYAAYTASDVEFSEPMKGLRAIAALYTSTSNWIAPESLGVEYVHDLAGKTIGIGPQDSTTDLSARAVTWALNLEQGGTTLKNCSLEAGAQQVREKKLDALHAFAGNPVSSLYQLALQQPCRILKYTDEELNTILAQNQFYIASEIPANTYSGQSEKIRTFGVKCLLCADSSMPEEQAYLLTKILYESREELVQSHSAMKEMLHPEFLYQDLPVPLHDGAARFYQEKGFQLDHGIRQVQ